MFGVVCVVGAVDVFGVGVCVCGGVVFQVNVFVVLL